LRRDGRGGAAGAERKLLYAWTQAGADGRWLARMVYQGGTRCPEPSAMRARPDTAFPVLVYEYAIPAGAADAWWATSASRRPTARAAWS
jgi:hypothetical protein